MVFHLNNIQYGFSAVYSRLNVASNKTIGEGDRIFSQMGGGVQVSQGL